MWYRHDFQFSGGFIPINNGSPDFFGRAITDNSKIFCFKYTFIRGADGEPMELVTDSNRIEIFSINDSRFTEVY